MDRLQSIAALGVAPIVEATYPEPFKSRMGRFECRLLADEFGLTQFGANLEILLPGAQSALRHWHSLSDEFVFVLEGTLVLRTDDGEVPVSAGMCIGFKAGTPNGHHFVNRSAAEARFLVVGTRVSGDVATYPDDDIMWCRDAGGSYVARKDGTPHNDRPMLRIGSIVWGVRDVVRATRFWCAALNYQPLGEPSDDWAVLVPCDGVGAQMAITKVSSRSKDHQRHHLDLYASNQGAEIDRLIDLGAERVDWRYPEGADYIVLADPDGNRFCVVHKS